MKRLRSLGLEYGFDVEEIPEQDIHNESVSSTKIRKALLDGNIQKANAYLDHHYIIMGLISEVNPKLTGNRFPKFQRQDRRRKQTDPSKRGLCSECE